MAKRPLERPDYRGFFVTMADDPDVHQLSGDAFKLLAMLKLSLPAIGIGVAYPSKLCDQVNCDRDRLELLLQELEKPQEQSGHGWIRRERNVIWVVNALRFEPHLNPHNRAKHVPFVRKLASALDQKLAVVRAFIGHYPEWFGDVPPGGGGHDVVDIGTSLPQRSKGERAGGTHTDRKAIGSGYQEDRVSKHSPIQPYPVPEPKSEDLCEGERACGEPASAPASGTADRPASLADAIRQLPRGARAWLARHYPRASTAPRRRLNIVRQLHAVLGAGQPFHGAQIRAYTPERLEAKCRQMARTKLRTQDRAIVVLLKKLGDTSDLIEIDRATTQARELQEYRDAAAHTQAAETWIAQRPEIAISIEYDLVLLLGAAPAPGVPGRPESLDVINRRVVRTSLVRRAYDAAHQSTARFTLATG